MHSLALAPFFCKITVSWQDVPACLFNTLIACAETNQIDEPLLNLLKQNADAARAAGQEEPAKFMEKIRDAAQKFLIK